MVLTNKLLKYIFFVWIIFAFCFNAQGQDSLRVRTMGKGTTPNIALLNAKLSALNEAGWSADEQNFFDLEGKAFLSSRILDAKTLPDSSYQVILD